MPKILLLEDDEQLAGQIMQLLENDGHEVRVFNTATAALIYLEAHKIDCVIADLFIRVDGKFVQDGGIKLISNIRQVQGKQIPIIAISGSFREQHGEYASSSAVTVGATANLAKPFHPDELSRLVNAQIKLHKPRRARA